MRTNRVAVVTGAASGIGRAVSEDLLGQGYLVWAIDTNAKALTEFEQSHGPKGVTVRVADVCDCDRLCQLAQEVMEKYSTLDVWINNAGISKIQDFTKQSASEWASVVQVNLMGVVNGTRAALSVMEPKGKGVIVNIASVAGHVAAPFMSAYSASKHAVVGFTRALQIELEMRQVQVRLVMISPGFVNTPIISRGTKSGFPEWLSGLLADPKDVAQSVVKAIDSKDREVMPTLNGKLVMAAFKVFPKTTMRSSKILLTKSLKDALLNRFNLPDKG